MGREYDGTEGAQKLLYIMDTTCVCPPALSSMLVVARVAELGKQVKKEDTVLETPWASSSWNQTQVLKTKSSSESQNEDLKHSK